MSIQLWTSWYFIADEHHRMECMRAIILNINNPLIANVNILCEIDFPAEHKNIRCIPVSERPSYDTFLKLFNMNDLNILCNTDIVLDYNTTHHFPKMKPNSAYVLSRYNLTNEYTLMMKDWNARLIQFPGVTQDVWALYKPNNLPDCSDILLGVLGCENRFAYKLFNSGIKLSNPCLSIKTYHLHCSDERSYSDSYHDKFFPGLSVSATSLNFSLMNRTRFAFIENVASGANPHNSMWKYI